MSWLPNLLRIPFVRNLPFHTEEEVPVDTPPVEEIHVGGVATLDFLRDTLTRPPPKVYVDANLPHPTIRYVDAFEWPTSPRMGYIFHIDHHTWCDLKYEYLARTSYSITDLPIEVTYVRFAG